MLERESANCRVEVPKTGSGLVIMLECEITNGSVLCCDKIVKKRGIAKSVVAEPLVLLLSAKAPTASLNSPSSLKTIASVPTAVFRSPVVLSNIAAAPTAVLESDPAPLVRASAPAPTPVSKLPLPTINSEYQPTPVSPTPPVTFKQSVAPFRRVKRGIAPVRIPRYLQR